MAEELRRKKSVRGGHKSSATRMMNTAEEMLENLENLDMAKFNQIGMSIKEKLSRLLMLRY